MIFGRLCTFSQHRAIVLPVTRFHVCLTILGTYKICGSKLLTIPYIPAEEELFSNLCLCRERRSFGNFSKLEK